MAAARLGHVPCFFAKSLDQFVKWHLSVYVCRRIPRSPLPQLQLTVPCLGRVVRGNEGWLPVVVLFCGGLLRLCHYPCYNLHALWWGIYLSHIPHTPHTAVPPAQLQLKPFIHISLHARVYLPLLLGPVIKKSLVISFCNPAQLFTFLFCAFHFFMILLAAKTSNFVTMFIGYSVARSSEGFWLWIWLVSALMCP